MHVIYTINITFHRDLKPPELLSKTIVFKMITAVTHQRYNGHIHVHAPSPCVCALCFMKVSSVYSWWGPVQNESKELITT